MKYFEYLQNNSSGKWDVSMPKAIVVVAKSAEEADEIAVKHGVYHYYKKGIDCLCCGPRWSEAIELDFTPAVNNEGICPRISQYILELQEEFNMDVKIIHA